MRQVTKASDPIAVPEQVLRVSVTLLDSYRLYRSQDWMKLSDIEDRIRGVFTATPAMDVGRGFHAVCERPDDHIHNERTFLACGQYFDRATTSTVYEELSRGVAEAKMARLVRTPDGLVRLVGKADYLRGASAYEIKTKNAALKPENYMDSIQWKSYCWLFGVKQVVYRLVQLKDSGGVWFVKQWDDLPLYAYPALEDELMGKLRELAEFIYQRGLQNHLLETS